MTIVTSHASFKIVPVNLNISLQDRKDKEISDFIDNKIFHTLFHTTYCIITIKAGDEYLDTRVFPINDLTF